MEGLSMKMIDVPRRRDRKIKGHVKRIGQQVEPATPESLSPCISPYEIDDVIWADLFASRLILEASGAHTK
jgi:hypothetical protein